MSSRSNALTLTTSVLCVTGHAIRYLVDLEQTIYDAASFLFMTLVTDFAAEPGASEVDRHQATIGAQVQREAHAKICRVLDCGRSVFKLLITLINHRRVSAVQRAVSPPELS